MNYKHRQVGKAWVDLLIAEKLIVESKAVESLAPIHWAQLIAYLKIARLPLGLLIDFNAPELRSPQKISAPSAPLGALALKAPGAFTQP